MIKSVVGDNIMLSITISAFFLLNNDNTAGGCCGVKSRKFNFDSKQQPVIIEKEVKWSKTLEDDVVNFAEITTKEFYENLGVDYFKKYESSKLEEKSQNIKKHIENLKNQIISNLETALEFEDNLDGNEEKGKRRLFQIILKGSDCVTNYEGEKIKGLKHFIEDEINKFYNNKGFKDYFLLAYILFKTNKSISELIKNKKNKTNNTSLNEVINVLNYKRIVDEAEQISRFKFYDKNKKVQKEFVLDFNDIDLTLTSLNIFNRIKYCFLVYLILITNEILDKFPIFVKQREKTMGVNVLQGAKDNSALVYLLTRMLNNKKASVDIYAAIAKTKFTTVKEIYKKIHEIKIPIFSEEGNLILLYNEKYFNKQKYFSDKKNNKDAYEELIKNNLIDSCKKYAYFYTYFKGKSNGLNKYIESIFKYKFQIENKKSITVLDVLQKYDDNCNRFNNNLIYLKNKFTKIKIDELTKYYDQIYKQQ